ncbi:hypothetical protein [Rhizobium lentis]|uniref:hypothetical protein n=1 Tax=Rhizobium lentis TaxID=1138194 RepID=UPI001613BB03|nr:hypothetical protein [Rhizobium lentis]MBB4572913.1 putative secreted protein [Rhizobium lentis]
MKKQLFFGGLLAAALAGLPGVSLAGDIASIQPIGFSADGKVFAFQEFGLKEGSNVPYSTRAIPRAPTTENDHDEPSPPYLRGQGKDSV